jgi:hypothetical protein
VLKLTSLSTGQSTAFETAIAPVVSFDNAEGMRIQVHISQDEQGSREKCEELLRTALIESEYARLRVRLRSLCNVRSQSR